MTLPEELRKTEVKLIDLWGTAQKIRPRWVEKPVKKDSKVLMSKFLPSTVVASVFEKLREELKEAFRSNRFDVPAEDVIDKVMGGGEE